MLTDIVSFLTSGGLLALVQAVLSFWASQQAKKQGADENAIHAATATLDHVQAAQTIDNTVAVQPAAGVIAELRDHYTRD